MKCVCGHEVDEHETKGPGCWGYNGNKLCGCILTVDEAKLSALRARIAAMREYLIDWEFAAGDEDGLYCSTCNGRKEKGHKPDCSYAALLKESEE